MSIEIQIRRDLSYISGRIKAMSLTYVDDNDKQITNVIDYSDLPVMIGAVASKEIIQDTRIYDINLSIHARPASSNGDLSKAIARSKMSDCMEAVFLAMTSRYVNGNKNPIALQGYYSKTGMRIHEIDNGTYGANKIYYMSASFDICKKVPDDCVGCSYFKDTIFTGYKPYMDKKYNL